MSAFGQCWLPAKGGAEDLVCHSCPIWDSCHAVEPLSHANKVPTCLASSLNLIQFIIGKKKKTYALKGVAWKGEENGAFLNSGISHGKSQKRKEQTLLRR